MITIKIKDISGNWHTLKGDSKKSITDQCDEKGIDSPFACRAWACTVCACKVEKGEEFLVQNKFWEKLIDLEEGHFLNCIGGLNDSDVESNADNEVILTYE